MQLNKSDGDGGLEEDEEEDEEGRELFPQHKMAAGGSYEVSYANQSALLAGK